MNELKIFDMGKYTMKALSGSDRFYQLKSDRTAHLVNTMAMYRQDGRFCDVNLCVNGQRFSAHKIVLAAACPYFCAMFNQTGHIEAHTAQDIDLSQTVRCSTAMSLILDFLYTSQIQLNDKCVLSVLATSSLLLIDDLIEICVAYLRDQLHASNCIGLYLYGKQFECLPLIEAAQHYIYEHFEDIIRHEEFLTLDFRDVYFILKADQVQVKCESIIYTAAMQWVRHDLLNRRKELSEILPCIRVQFLDPLFLKGVINCDEFAQPDMQRCREYLENAYENLTSHRYCQLPPHRAPIKPLVLYCAGGYYNQSINTMECYFLETQKWKRCANLQIPRSGVGVVSIHMRVYVIGGRHNTKNDNRDCREVECYDPFVNRWTTVAPMIYPRNRLGVGTIDHYMYAVGGSCYQELYSTVERYSPTSDSAVWEEVASMHVKRIGLAVCTHTRLLYAIGGFDGHRRLADVESYDPDKNIWKREQPLLCSRSGAAAAPLAQYIYVVGGYASDSITGPMQLDVVERYDTITQQWSYVQSLNCRRSALSCVTLDKRLFALGGYDGKNFSSVVEIYDPEKDEWTYGTSLTKERSGHGSALTVEPTLDEDDD
ncbi:unnamed protein product [Adineta steineri]|uniref:BTB domain-containing protein n=1 Tax=Adineta steineri TaxID=433720 RepID=A0A818W032_9BILA|nr:unnamed protein product [Adineta steineri]CAF3718489.1 unnamed protein product [Adineta steineri]